MCRSDIVAKSRWIRAGCLITFATLCNATSAQEKFTPVSIRIGAKIDPKLTPLVYVDGVLSGAINGAVLLPDRAESTIEIGLPQARQPFYSFKLGPKQFETSSAKVIMTSYFDEGAGADSPWSNVKLEPNTVSDLQLRRAESGGYELELPAGPYDGFDEIIKKYDVTRSSKNWMEAIPQANDTSKLGGITHLTATANEQSWSGSYAAAYRSSFPQPGYREREWKIQSQPPGAMIVTQVGDMGLTNRTIQLPDLSETFVILQLPGYADCPHDGAQCKLTDTGPAVELQCNLKKK